jgi:3-phenylpropionate/trans-cinnamate dioxygenase ferredoxin subunit
MIDLCGVHEIEPNTARRFDVDGLRVALVRIGDDFYAIGDRCTHADVSLAEGEIDSEERTIECWKHGSQFDLATGAPLSLPAIKATPTYEVRVEHDRVLIETRR